MGLYKPWHVLNNDLSMKEIDESCFTSIDIFNVHKDGCWNLWHLPKIQPIMRLPNIEWIGLSRLIFSEMAKHMPCLLAVPYSKFSWTGEKTMIASNKAKIENVFMNWMNEFTDLRFTFCLSSLTKFRIYQLLLG